MAVQLAHQGIANLVFRVIIEQRLADISGAHSQLVVTRGLLGIAVGCAALGVQAGVVLVTASVECVVREALAAAAVGLVEKELDNLTVVVVFLDTVGLAQIGWLGLTTASVHNARDRIDHVILNRLDDVILETVDNRIDDMIDNRVDNMIDNRVDNGILEPAANRADESLLDFLRSGSLDAHRAHGHQYQRYCKEFHFENKNVVLMFSLALKK
jgi:hypothetical protein